jgi:hypothetical protein
MRSNGDRRVTGRRRGRRNEDAGGVRSSGLEVEQMVSLETCV